MKADYVHKDTRTIVVDGVEIQTSLSAVEIADLYQKNQELKKENQELKKQLENDNEQISYLRRSIERKEERIIELQDERIPYTNEYVDKILNQQKEFIEYLESEIDRLEKTEFYIDSIQKAVIETHKHNLSKYREIIGESK